MKRILCLIVIFLLCLCSYAEDSPSNFEVHYLDVGQGNAEIVICDGHVLMILWNEMPRNKVKRLINSWIVTI